MSHCSFPLSHFFRFQPLDEVVSVTLHSFTGKGRGMAWWYWGPPFWQGRFAHTSCGCSCYLCRKGSLATRSSCRTLNIDKVLYNRSYVRTCKTNALLHSCLCFVTLICGGGLFKTIVCDHYFVCHAFTPAVLLFGAGAFCGNIFLLSIFNWPALWASPDSSWALLCPFWQLVVHIVEQLVQLVPLGLGEN